MRAETFETYINKKGGKSYKAEFLPRTFYDECMKTEKGQKFLKYKYRKVDLVPCGKCIECQLSYARQWSTDCICEKKYWPDEQCWFITLTYSDEYLPQAEYKTEDGKIYKGISLRKKDLQDFWKRVRKHYDCKIKYLNAGEYGTLGRPHYHAIVFGLPLKTENFKYLGKNNNGDAYWTEPELEKIWGKGNIIIGQVTQKSINYVVRYTIKKWKNKDSGLNKMMGRTPEFISMSQGLGKRYWEENEEKIILQDCIITPEGEMPITQRFLKNLKNKDQKIYTTIKEKHKQQAETAQKQAETDKSPEEQREARESIRKANFTDIRRRTQ